MASTISTFRAKLQARVKGDNKLTASPDMTCEWDRAFLRALEQYSKDRPRKRSKDVTGTGSFDYPLSGGSPVLPGWTEGLSSIQQVIFPYVSTQQIPPVPLTQNEDYAVVHLDGDVPYLRFFSATPSASQHALVSYTSPHVVDAAGSTVPASDEEAVSDLGAACACDSLADFYSQSTNATIAADSVNQISKAAEYRADAKRFRDSYAEMIGKPKDGAPLAAAAAVDMDRTFGDRFSTDLFFHGRGRF